NRLRSVCGERPRPTPAPKLLTNPNIGGLPTVGERWLVAMSFRDRWGALFPSIRKNKTRFIPFPLKFRPHRPLNNKLSPTSWIGLLSSVSASALIPLLPSALPLQP